MDDVIDDAVSFVIRADPIIVITSFTCAIKILTLVENHGIVENVFGMLHRNVVGLVIRQAWFRLSVGQGIFACKVGVHLVLGEAYKVRGFTIQAYFADSDI